MIVHLTTRAQWQAAQQAGVYVAPSLGQQGFIHCSEVTEEQLVAVANVLYRGQPDLIALLIDPARLHARLVWEEFAPDSPHYPHLYGPLNLNAVVDVQAMTPDDSGQFTLPDPWR